MKKIITLFLAISFHTGFSQIYEVGGTLNMVNIMGDKSTGVTSLFDLDLSPSNIGLIIKKNRNPRIAYRFTVNHLRSSDLGVRIAEVTLGLDFNFKKYNLIRYRKGERSTPYFILEGAVGAFNSPGVGTKPFIALPVGIGYKSAITQKIVFSLEAKGRVPLTDELDGDSSNGGTYDSYYYVGASVYYAFGWPRKSKDRSKF